ncbi:N-formylglutamate amidohydrolase [Ideonella sp. DXS29W]|uniref:N-formylglutamate amidohydrolase n=1 Tax=Ideonella lacteola TaxID=2984193 RepID=A0ABU9BVI9_9BURK
MSLKSDAPFDVIAGEAQADSPLVFDSPHSWPHWPADVPTIAPTEALRTSCDAWVDEIWAAALQGRAPLLTARFHRSYIDANRARDDIDPALLAQPWPVSLHPSDRSRRGFGLLRRLALPGVPVYREPLAVTDVARRIERFYDPYHHQLAALIDAARPHHDAVLHINCHSMKSVGNAMNEDCGRPRPDIVLSDRDGQTAGAPVLGWMASALRERGYRVQFNDPYRGEEILRRHGCPRRGRYSVQIELRRDLYMDERCFERHSGFDRLVGDLKACVGLWLEEWPDGPRVGPALG